MVGLVLSQVMLFLAAAAFGFAIGWRLYAEYAASRRRGETRTLEQLRHALTEAQVRRARES
jgi:hypothetical protein